MEGWPIPFWGTVETFLGLSAIIIARYFLIVAPIHWALWKREPKKARRLSRRDPTRATITNEIRLSTVSAFIYAFPAAIVLEMWKAGGTAIYGGLPSGLGEWLWIPASAALYLFAQDTWFYFSHRLMHHPKLFKHTHAGHHRSVQPTPWASFSFDPIEAVSMAWLLPVMALFVPIHIHSIPYIIGFAVMGTMMLASLGLAGGIWSEKFDHIAAVTNFLVTPLTFLSGTFYSIERLPEVWQTVAHYNPFFHMIDGFRYGFIGQADGSPLVGVMFLAAINVILMVVCLRMLKTGYKIKS